jgi:UDP-GlcNAc:undecaprenyl-phosphate/decaprenyl-phosphate GlcNAc-1-phosphate transferase
VVPAVLLLILLGFAISLPATAAARAIGRRTGALDSPGAAGHTKVLRSVPNIGGVAIFLGVAFPLAAAITAVILLDDQVVARLIPALTDHLPRLRESLPLAIAMLVCVTVLHVTGLVDDRRSLGPWIKLGVQIAVAFGLAWHFDVRLLTMLDRTLPFAPWPSVILTVLWIVVVTNAMNFLDNMDGLAAGVAVVAAGLFMAATLVNHQWFIAATLALLAGSTLGFLIFNAPPATIFMGDGGSLVIGFLLGVLTARTTYHDAANPDFALGGGWYAVFMPLVVLAVPLYDFCSVTIIRLLQGKSPFVGDQQHYSHRLVQRGLSKRQAVATIWALTAVTGIGGVMLGRLQAWQAVLVGVQTGLVLLVLAMLEYRSGRSTKTNS